MSRWRGWFWGLLGLLLLVSRLAHRGILWADEDYHLAAGIQLLHGKLPYRDFWYDKPPLSALLTLAFGAQAGVPLRIAGTLLALCCCWLAYLLAKSLWDSHVGYVAAGLLAFFLIFYMPTGVIPLEPDTWMLAPHLAAVLFAVRKKPMWSGLFCGIASLIHIKGLAVLAVCFVISPSWILLVGPVAAFAAMFSFPGYIDQVWRWGIAYAAGSKSYLPIVRWLGFHAALAAGVVWYAWKERDKQARWISARWMTAWIAISLATLVVGGPIAPRYFQQLLPALVIPAARGLRLKPVLLALLLIPLVRFGPRYFALNSDWADTAMDRESRQAAALIHPQPGDTLTIWGYRPNVDVYTRMPVASRYWDSQPLTGVPADRHLSISKSTVPDWAARNRAEFATSRPTYLVDGLSGYNAELGIDRYPELTEWFSHYCPIGQAGLTRVYRRCRE